jgi:hypothetical protein
MTKAELLWTKLVFIFLWRKELHMKFKQLIEHLRRLIKIWPK